MMKIIELKIDDILNGSGVDGIALVENPAIEEDWYWFSEEKLYIVKEDQLDKLGKLMKKYGQPVEELNDEGWIIVKVEGVNAKEEFAIISDPNAPSAEDGPDSNSGLITRTRYKYAGPQDSKNRTFCGDMMSANRVFRREDIDQMTIDMSNPEFGSYNIFEYRGSYNCRHRWIKVTYKMDGRILNKSSSRRGVIGTEDIEQLPTETDETANAKQRDKAGFSILDTIDGEPVYSTIEEALIRAEYLGCEGYHEHKVTNDTTGYMACLNHTPSTKTKFSLDEEKRTITGPAMIPDKMIPRRGPMGEVYSVFFTDDTIRKISEKFLREKHTDKTNLEHTPINLSDVYVIESWIIEDPSNDKSTKFGYDLPKGTWMVSMKVEDDKIWKSVKQGNIKGFSVEGYFVEKLIFNKEDEQVQTIINILNNTKDE